MEYVTFERRLLHLMFRTNTPLTPVHIAYYLDLPIAEARSHLDHMVELGILELDSDDHGHLLYTYPLRPPASELPPPRPPRRKKKKKLDPGQGDDRPGSSGSARSAAPSVDAGVPVPVLSLLRDDTLPVPRLTAVPPSAQAMRESDPDRALELVMVDGRRYYSPAAAAALSLFLPGVGQIYTGRVPQGVGWMLATGMGYLLFLIPGLILHICCIVNAAAVPARVPMLAERVR
jgi:TM2 domain-containing membrane protein YozV